MGDYTDSPEASLERIGNQLGEINQQLAGLRDTLSDERFHDECAMRAMEGLAVNGGALDVDDLRRANAVQLIRGTAFYLADAMTAERKRRRG